MNLCVDALRNTQQFFSYVWSFSQVKSVLSSENKHLAQGHKTVPPVRLEPGTSQFLVEHSAIEPLCSSCTLMMNTVMCYMRMGLGVI